MTSHHGFGVGLATRTQRNLEAADPESLRAIVDDAWTHDMAMEVGDRRVHLPVDNLIAIGRARLLEILRRHAEEVGVAIHYGKRVEAHELEAELVVAADGVSSPTREKLSSALGATVDLHDAPYLWCGTDFALESAVFVPVTSPEGTFVAHAYPYARDRSTFLVETDPDTWLKAGFDVTTAATPFDESDEEALTYLSEVFADQLGGRRLIGNRTRWTQFRTIACQRWSVGNVVLLGDAAHTAHYSIGSGTKLAMEDGIALATALDQQADLPAALAEYERARRPAVEHLQDTAALSMGWWDDFPARSTLPLEQLLIAYMTRAGKVSVDRFMTLAPAVVRSGLAQFAGCRTEDVPHEGLTDWILAQPLATRDRFWSGRVADGADLTGLLRLPTPEAPASATSAPDPFRGVVLDASGGHNEVLARGVDGERLRRDGHVVALKVPSTARELAAAALASGRADLIEFARTPGTR